MPWFQPTTVRKKYYSNWASQLIKEIINSCTVGKAEIAELLPNQHFYCCKLGECHCHYWYSQWRSFTSLCIKIWNEADLTLKKIKISHRITKLCPFGIVAAYIYENYKRTNRTTPKRINNLNWNCPTFLYNLLLDISLNRICFFFISV